MALLEVSPLSFVGLTLDTKLIIYISPEGQGIGGPNKEFKFAYISFV